MPLYNRLRELQTGTAAPTTMPARIRDVQLRRDPLTVGMGAPIGMPEAPPSLGPSRPGLGALLQSGLTQVGSGLAAGYYAGRGAYPSAQAEMARGQAQGQQILDQDRERQMVAALSQELPNGISNDTEMRQAMQIAMAYGMDPQAAMGMMIQGYQQRQALAAQMAEMAYKREASRREFDPGDVKAVRSRLEGREAETFYRDMMRSIANVDVAYRAFMREGSAKNAQAYNQAVTSFARLLDPGSVVRGEEFLRVEAMQSLIDQIQSAALKTATGVPNERLVKDVAEMALLVGERATRDYRAALWDPYVDSTRYWQDRWQVPEEQFVAGLANPANYESGLASLRAQLEGDSPAREFETLPEGAEPVPDQPGVYRLPDGTLIEEF